MNWWTLVWIILAVSLIVFVITMCLIAAGAEQDRMQDELDKMDGVK